MNPKPLPAPAAEILNFWFGPLLRRSQVIPKKRRILWFGGHTKTDNLIRERFSGLLSKALSGDCRFWGANALGRLALIVLLDQFSRNIYRGTPAAFGGDALALATTLAGLEIKDDLELPPIGRAFFYLPLEHAEDLVLQEKSVAAFDCLRHIVPKTQQSTYHDFFKYAIRHHDVIVRFGRFPHRNRILGRANTTEESAFLQQAGSSF